MRADAESDLADAGLAEAIAGSETETPDTAVPDAAVPALGLPCKVNSDCAPATVPCHVARCQLDFHCAVVQETDGAACDDGDACTAKDQCKGGACAAGPPACGCKSNAECAALDDGDKCNGGWRCDLASTPPRCEADPASAPTCFPLTEEPCQLNVCVPATGACAPKPAADGTVCDDGLFCT